MYPIRPVYTAYASTRRAKVGDLMGRFRVKLGSFLVDQQEFISQLNWCGSVL